MKALVWVNVPQMLSCGVHWHTLDFWWSSGRLPQTILWVFLMDDPAGFHGPFSSWNIFGQHMTSSISQRSCEIKKAINLSGSLGRPRKASLQICCVKVMRQILSPSLTHGLLSCKMGILSWQAIERKEELANCQWHKPVNGDLISLMRLAF